MASENETVMVLGETPFIKISADTFHQTTFVIKVICIPILCCFGLLGNSVGLRLLVRDEQSRRTWFYTYMVALMVCHVLNDTISLFRSVPHVVSLYDHNLSNVLKWNSDRVLVFSAMFIDHISAATLILMSLGRLLSLMKPFTFKTFWTSKYPRALLCVSGLISALYLTPIVPCLEVTTYQTFDNKTHVALKISQRCDGFISIFQGINVCMMFYIAPLSILILNSGIMIAHRRGLSFSQAENQRDSTRNRYHTRLTVIILSIMSSYLLMSVPYMISQTLALSDSRYYYQAPYSLVFYLLAYTGDMLDHVNTICDSVVYIFVSRQESCCKIKTGCFFLCNRPQQNDDSPLAVSNS